RAGVHDATLGDELCRRRRCREFLPRRLDLPPATLRAVTVHQHGVLLDGIRELGVRLELLHRGAVIAEPVLGETDQLAHRRRVGAAAPVVTLLAVGLVVRPETPLTARALLRWLLPA